MENKDIEDLLLKVKLTPNSKLKENILQDVYKIKITENKFQLRNTAFKKIAFAFCICVVLLLIMISVVNINQYNQTYTQIYFDINPSIELNINKYNYVASIRYLSDDAEEVFSDTQIINMKIEKAIYNILYTLENKDYFNENNELFISGYSKNKDISSELDKIYEKTEIFMENRDHPININKDKLTKDDIMGGKEHGMSPMKNKIIDEILGLGGPGTKEDWKDKPMGELKDKLDELKDKHDMPPKDYPNPPYRKEYE